MFYQSSRINSGNQALTHDEIKHFAPSVFATQANEKTTSEKYLFVPTVQVVEQIEAQGYSVTKAMQSRAKTAGGRDYVKHMLRFRKTESLEKGLLNAKDSSTELILVNSHNGSSAFQLHLGVFRIACLNGMIAGDIFAAQSVRHIGFSNDKIIEAQYQVLGNETKLIESVESMRSVQLNQDEKMLLASTALSVRYDKDETQPRPEQLLRPRRQADSASDLWSTFNVIQENIIKGGLRTISANERGQTKRNSTREVKSVDQNKKLNQALWTLAEEMRKIKGVA